MEIVKEHNCFSEIITKTEIGLPCTPSKWVAEPQYTNISIIHLTYGGGMGGAHEILYCRRINNLYDALRENQFLSVTNVEGNEIIINTRFVVKANNNYQMLSVLMENKNNVKPIGINQFNYLVLNNHKVTLYNDYDHKLPR